MIYIWKKEVKPSTTPRGFLKFRMSQVFSVSSPENKDTSEWVTWNIKLAFVERVNQSMNHIIRDSDGSQLRWGSPDYCWLKLFKVFSLTRELYEEPTTGWFLKERLYCRSCHSLGTSFWGIDKTATLFPRLPRKGHGKDKKYILWRQLHFVSGTNIKTHRFKMVKADRIRVGCMTVTFITVRNVIWLQDRFSTAWLVQNICY